MFEGRVPAKFADLAPRIVVGDDGSESWLYDGQVNPNVGLAAVAGRPIEECTYDPVRYDEMRPGNYDIHARIHDMDIDGVYASVNFPSALPGFCGHRLQLGISDPELALAVVRGVERLAPRRLGGRVPRAHHPVPDPVAARPRGRGRRDPAQRGARVQGGVVLGEP